jgi:hypothetical protein
MTAVAATMRRFLRHPPPERYDDGGAVIRATVAAPRASPCRAARAPVQKKHQKRERKAESDRDRERKNGHAQED